MKGLNENRWLENTFLNGKHMLSIILLAFVLAVSVFGHSVMNVMAEETEDSGIQRYYTCVEIGNDDTLWSIAKKYAPETGLTIEEYVEVLKEMNGIKEEVIHYGRYLTVMYTGQSQ